MKKKKTRKVVVAVCAVTLAGLLALFQVISDTQKSSLPVAVQCEPLQKTTLQSTVTASGTVKSASRTNVYTNLSTCVVQNVHVEVGDHVEAGDILCQLDSETLQETLDKQRLSLEVSSSASAQNIANSQKQYNDAQNNLSNGMNSTVNSARNATDSAKRALDKAQSDYDKARKELGDDMNSQLVQAEQALENAFTAEKRAEESYNKAKDQVGTEYKDLRQDASNAKKEYTAAQKVVDDLTNQLVKDPNNTELKSRLEIAKADAASAKASWDAAQATLDDYETDEATSYGALSLKTVRQNYEDAKTARESAQKSLELAKSAVDDQLSSYERALNEAQIAYDSAVDTQKTTENSVRQGLEDQRNALAASRTSADTRVQEAEIASLEDQLLDCTVTAPVSGTVTEVYATEGANPTGVIFVIEDTSNLELDISVKEYDIGSVAEGMKAVIRADALSDQQFSGELASIAPASKSSASTAAAATASTNVEFAATVTVDERDTPLRIGMNAKADIVLEEHTGVFAVPFEALGTDAAGNSIVYLARDAGNGVYTATPVPVETGLETDLYIEISGEGLTEGATIISNAESVKPGQRITIAAAQDASSQATDLMGMMMG